MKSGKKSCGLPPLPHGYQLAASLARQSVCVGTHVRKGDVEDSPSPCEAAHPPLARMTRPGDKAWSMARGCESKVW
jgi:hypothetical protein